MPSFGGEYVRARLHRHQLQSTLERHLLVHLEQQVDCLGLCIVRHVERHDLLHQLQEVVCWLFCLDSLYPLCANLAC